MGQPAAAADLGTDYIDRRNTSTNSATKLVATHPGLTCAELADKTDKDRHILARRLPEAANAPAPAIFRGATRTCSISGRVALTWWPQPVPGAA